MNATKLAVLIVLIASGFVLADTTLSVSRAGSSTDVVKKSDYSIDVASSAVQATYYVDGERGNDSNACTSGDAGACRTIQGAVNKLPDNINSRVEIHIAGGHDGGYQYYNGIDIPAIKFGYAGYTLGLGQGSGGLYFIGEMKLSPPSSGVTSAYLLSWDAGGSDPRNFSSVTVSGAGWPDGGLISKYLKLTRPDGGIGYYTISENSSDTIVVNGYVLTSFAVQPGTFMDLVEPAVVVNGSYWDGGVGTEIYNTTLSGGAGANLLFYYMKFLTNSTMYTSSSNTYAGFYYSTIETTVGADVMSVPSNSSVFMYNCITKACNGRYLVTYTYDNSSFTAYYNQAYCDSLGTSFWLRTGNDSTIYSFGTTFTNVNLPFNLAATNSITVISNKFNNVGGGVAVWDPGPDNWAHDFSSINVYNNYFKYVSSYAYYFGGPGVTMIPAQGGYVAIKGNYGDYVGTYGMIVSGGASAMRLSGNEVHGLLGDTWIDGTILQDSDLSFMSNHCYKNLVTGSKVCIY